MRRLRRRRRPARVRTNGLAVASLGFAILWIFGLGSLVAIVLGLVARRQIAASAGEQEGRTAATLGVALGVLGLLVLLFFLANAAAPE